MKKGWIRCTTLLMGLFVFASVLFAQDDFAKYTDFLPAPPNAAAIAKYGFINLNKNTGAPAVSIPLFTVKGNKLSTPIALSYASAGIKVDEIASRVGMGWALNMGGVISRTVRGVADEMRPRATPWSSVGNNWPTYNFARSIINATNATGNDGEPDLFTFNFNGYSGSFVFDPAMNIVLLTKSDIKVAYDFSGTSWNFRITTPDGVRYYFGGNSATEKTKRTSSCGKTYDYFVPNAWYLKKIEHSNGEVIVFTYEAHEYLYETGVSQTMYWVNPQPLTYCPSTSTCATPPTATCINTVITQGVLLKSIEASGRTRLSVAYRNRQDCNDSLISKLTLTDLIKNRTVGAYEFTYQDIVATGPSNQYAVGYDHTPYLAILQEQSADALMVKTHQFSYLSPALRAYRLSYAQDHWGYYNGKNNQSLTPKPDAKIIGGSKEMISHFPNATANRDPDAAFSMMGMLSRIDYPTGGYDSILYEGNTIRTQVDISPLHRALASITGAGLKSTKSDTVSFTISQTQELDLLANCLDNTGNGSFDSVHNFGHLAILDGGNNTVYETMLIPGTQNRLYPVIIAGSYKIVVSASGASVTTNLTMEYKPQQNMVMRNELVGGIRVAAVFTGNSMEKPVIKKYYYAALDSLHASSMTQDAKPQYILSTRTESVCGSSNVLSCATVNLHANSLNTLNDYQGTLASYASVVESHGEHFEGGATETKYITQRDGAGDLLLGYDFPNAPRTNYSHAFNGKLKEEIVWKKTGSGFLPAKKTVHKYKYDARGYREVFGYTVNGRYGVYPDYNSPSLDTTDNSLVNGSGGPSILQIFVSRLDIVRYKTLADWTYVDSTIEYLYDEQGLNPLVSVSRNYYDTSAHTQVTRTETQNSKGENLKTQYLYPTDFGGQGVYDSMISRNILLPVVSIQYNNGNEIVRVKTQFADWGGGNIAPSAIQKSFLGDSLVTEGTMDAYDAAGNLLQFTGKDGVPNALLWGYGYSYPVARISGASYAAVTAALDVTVAALQDMGGNVLQETLHRLRNTLTNARVTTYTYLPMTGITTMIDERNQKTGYEYDSFQRLLHVRDQDSNLIKKYDYSYAGPGTVTDMPIYYNASTSNIFNCSTCITGYTSASVNYNVPAGKYYSFVSQAEADSLAEADVLANGQLYANAAAICAKTFVHTYYSAAASGTYQKQCDAGGTGTTHTYTVSAGTYTSIISQADADQKAQNDVNANGQNNANTLGTCTYYSVAKSGTYQKQCDPGGTGSTHTYTVAAGTYTSNVSQADADQKAQNDVNANGQNNANTLGTCTYYSVVKSGVFQKQCGPGGTGTTHTYTVVAGSYSSNISQADADQKAQNDVNANGQNNANTLGTCTYYSVVKSGVFQKQCGPGGTGTTHTYTVAAGSYWSNISQADADQKAQDDVNANGQNNANTLGTCTYYSVAKSGTYQKQCDPGGTGSTHTYTVAAGSYSSNISQADADQKAQNDVNANGQNNANTLGTCTYYSVAKSGTYQKQCDPGGFGSTHTYTVAAGSYSSNISQADADQKAQNDVNANGQSYVNSIGTCTFYNVAKSGTFQRDNCNAGGTGSYVTYTVLANTYSSTISQADADQKAQNDVNANGQANANNLGYCTWYNTVQSASFQKNDCGSGGTGSYVTYTVPAGTYSSTISQTNANNLASNAVYANGQAYANSNGYCTWYNTAQSGSFQKNNCPSGGTGSYVTYTVAANTYSSTSSQADANQQAVNAVNAYGQTHANSNGYCTFYNSQQSGTFQKNNCGTGGTGSYVTYTVAASTYSSTSSQADADQQAINAVNAYGQTNANNNGYCTYYNTAQSASYQKNNCASGGTGSYVTYTVNAGTYVSYSSQADANQQALNEISANGQSNANSNGYCTFYNTMQSVLFQKNNCSSGGSGSYVYYNVPAYSYSSTISQADADQLALNEAYANGQSNANSTGYCTYYNTTQSAVFQKDNCTSTGTGSYVTYTIYAGTYYSHVSQADADQMATNAINANGQAYANTNGICAFYSDAYSATYQKNDCGSGGTGSYVTYTVPAGAYVSTISRTHANNQALNDLNSNGQAYANSNGYCVYYNTVQSGTFQRNNCSSGTTGSYVTYTVPANTYVSYSSQYDANQQAINDVNSNGQTYANNNGSCTSTQTDVYAVLVYENVYDYFDGYSYGDLVVRYYSDAYATVPTSANNLNINYAAYDQCASFYNDTYYGAYGYYTYLQYGAPLSYPPYWCDYPCYSPCYISYQLTSGTGYIIL